MQLPWELGGHLSGVHPYEAVKALSSLAGRMNQGRANSLLTFSSERTGFLGPLGDPTRWSLTVVVLFCVLRMPLGQGGK